MEQMRLEWEEPTGQGDPIEVVLDPETTEAIVALMARALIIVVCAAEEATDER